MADLSTPLPDPAHENLRQACVAAVERLAEHVDRLDNSFLLTQTAFDFANTVLAAVAPLQQAVADLQAQMTDLQAQVAALTPAPNP